MVLVQRPLSVAQPGDWIQPLIFSRAQQELYSNDPQPVYNPGGSVLPLKEPGWHVLGAGAIGCLFSAALENVGGTCTLLLRRTVGPENAEVRIEADTGTRQLLLPVSSCAEEGRIAQLLVTTKAYDVQTALSSVRHRLDGDSQVLLMVNGMGFTAPLLREFPWLNLYHGTTTEGAYRIAPRHIRHAGSGQTRIGKQDGGEAPQWFQRWSCALAKCQWDADISRALWLKLAINCAINPLTAVHSCRNGELARDPLLRSRVAELCREIQRVSSAAGYEETALGLQQSVAKVITATANNHSSMLQDIRSGRPTEIEYITGHLVNVAQQHGIAVPENTALLQQVRELEH